MEYELADMSGRCQRSPNTKRLVNSASLGEVDATVVFTVLARAASAAASSSMRPALLLGRPVFQKSRRVVTNDPSANISRELS